ncbi:MAG: hypothetical protein WA885_03135 [Phormidesmis sp.]
MIFKQIYGVALGVAALTLGATNAIQAQGEATPGEATPEEAAPVVSQAEPATIAVPALPSPEPTPFSPNLSGITDLSSGAKSIMSVGHLRPENIEAVTEGRANWLERAVIPLYISPGGDHWGWIYQGWLIPKGQTYLAIGRDASFAMVRSDADLYTFPVLEVREDGWFRVQYTPGGSAWAHTSQLNLGDVPLVLEPWEERLQAQDAVYFLDSAKAQPLRSQPQSATNMLSLVSADSLIEPIGFEGDWMQVRVTRPTADCQPLTGATVTEGWMRWRNPEGSSLVWYQPDESCAL